MLDELKIKYENLKERLDTLMDAVDYEALKKRLSKIEKKMGKPDFWNDQENAQETVSEMKGVKALTDPIELAVAKLEDAKVMLQLIEEENGSRENEIELQKDLDSVERKMERFEFLQTMKGKSDKRDAFLSVQAGAGGTDSCDWAEMLLRMYQKYLEENNFELSLIDKQEHDEAGIKSATVLVKGAYAFGYMKGETGVHRLVRLSPFDFNERRHTSFASVDVVPVYDEEINIEINESDLRIDTYRSSGAGGQHVNVTDSAVRITHLPSGIVVTCQNERSQHLNRQVAMKLLAAKLYRIEEKKREEELKTLHGEKGEISWGTQIRSYIMHPYTLVKDHRTGVETGRVQEVLDGKIDQFIEAYLKLTLKSGE